MRCENCGVGIVQMRMDPEGRWADPTNPWGYECARSDFGHKPTLVGADAWGYVICGRCHGGVPVERTRDGICDWCREGE